MTSCCGSGVGVSIAVRRTAVYRVRALPLDDIVGKCHVRYLDWALEELKPHQQMQRNPRPVIIIMSIDSYEMKCVFKCIQCHVIYHSYVCHFNTGFGY